jgi:hypothetical protein
MITDAELDALAVTEYGLNDPKTGINPFTGEPDIPDGPSRRDEAAGFKMGYRREERVLDAIINGV